MSRAASRNMPAAEKEGIRFILVLFDLISRGCTDQEDSTGDDKKKTNRTKVESYQGNKRVAGSEQSD